MSLRLLSVSTSLRASTVKLGRRFLSQQATTSACSLRSPTASLVVAGTAVLAFTGFCASVYESQKKDFTYPSTIRFQDASTKSNNRFKVNISSQKKTKSYFGLDGRRELVSELIQKCLFSALSLEQARALVAETNSYNDSIITIDYDIMTAMNQFHHDSKLSPGTSIGLQALHMKKNKLKADFVQFVRDLYSRSEATQSKLSNPTLMMKMRLLGKIVPSEQLSITCSEFIASHIQDINGYLDHSKRPVAYVIDYFVFSDNDSICDKVDAIIAHSSVKENQTKGKTAIIRLSHAFNSSAEYDAAAQQLLKLKKHGFHVKVCIDDGICGNQLMIAAVADEVLAAPTASVHSLAQIQQFPSLKRRMNMTGEYEHELKAGEFKSALSTNSEHTADMKKYRESKLNEELRLVKEYLLRHRPQIDVQSLASGQKVLGSDAVSFGAVDAIQTFAALKDQLEDKLLYRIVEVKCRKEELRLEEELKKLKEKEQVIKKDDVAHRA